MQLTLAGLAVVLLGILQQDRENLLTGIGRLMEQKSYRWSRAVRMADQEQVFTGVYVSPDLVTLRTASREVVVKGDKAAVKSGMDWRPKDKLKDRVAQRLVKELKPPHEHLARLVEKLEKVCRGEEQEIERVKCSSFQGTVAGDALKEIVIESLHDLASLGSMIDWTASTAKIVIYVGPKDLLPRKVEQETTFVFHRNASGPIIQTIVTEYREFDKVTLTLDAQAREILEIEP